MDQRHQEYADYYRVRAARLADHPLYVESLAAEQARYEALAGVAQLEDFRQVNEERQLGLRCSVARVVDQARERLRHYTALQEVVRASGPARILELAPRATSETELREQVNAAEGQASIAITVDSFIEIVADDIEQLEEIEVMERAAIPEEWRQEDRASIAEMRARAAADYLEQRQHHREYDPHWELDYALVWAERHRRVIPLPDETLRRRVAAHRGYRGVC